MTYNKLLYTTCLLFVLSLNFFEATAQKKKDVRDIIMSGNEYYFQDQYSKAIEFYQKAVSIDSLNSYANYHLAECHRKIFNFAEAEKYYKTSARNHSGEYPLAGFYYPQMQKFNGNFHDAIKNFGTFISFASGNSFGEKDEFLEKAVIERKGCYFAISHLENPFGEYNLTNLPNPINSKYNDYGPFILDSDSAIGLTSGRSTVTGKIMNNRYGEYFSDNFRFIKDSTGWVQIIGNDNFKINNTEFGEGSGSYSKDQQVFYFTGCYEDGSYCKIYRSVKKDGRWQAPLELESPVNLKNSDNKQPSVTAGGDTLFFVSDREGGLGGNDIWMSVKNSDNSWQTPVNLGEKINTAYNEVSPHYYATEDILFFASDGHEGLGGLDLFMAKGGVGTVASVDNLGFPFNSNHDDGYMVLGKQKGYFTSNREGGLGNFDVYQFSITTFQSIIAEVNEGKISPRRILRSRVSSRTGGEVYVMREEDQFFYENLQREEKAIISKIIAAKLDNFASKNDLNLTPVEREFYNNLSLLDKLRLGRMTHILYNEGSVDLGTYLKALPVRQVLYSHLTISGKLFEKASGNPAPGVLIPLVDEFGKIIKETTTNADGTFKYVNLPLNKQYRILAENIPKKFTESAKFFIKDMEIKEVTHELVVINFEDIYFDVNKEELRPEAKKVIDELISFYSNNPNIQIEIFAFTDTTGSDDYNFQLSRNRGQSAYDYLIAGNVDPSALVIEAQGKDVGAFAEIDQVNLQLNRRVEFSIVGAKTPFSSTVKTYILKKKVTLDQLAKETGNSIDELKALNGLTTSFIPAFTPVRINSQQVLSLPELLYRLPDEQKVEAAL